ncbi:MAG: class I SAM-dependent methyltransferase [Thermoleophilia bacterium]
MRERPFLPNAADSFDRSAAVYDDHVAHNRAGAARLVASLPAGEYPRLLDVACGTGFASLAAIPRLGVRQVTAADASAAMVEVFRERLATAHPDVAADLRACDVLAIDVEPGSADLVLCTMALHWFTERAAAIALMARALAPGGVLGVLAPGPEHDAATVARIRATGDPGLIRLADSIEANEVDPGVLAGYLRAAGLEPVDVWTETRSRTTTAAAYGARLDAVASHLWDDLPAEAQAGVSRRLHALLEGAADADGLYRYRFVKTFAVARAPEA